MQELDHKKCGAFIALLRKQQGMTQKELAQKLMLSDKAVSKWERGLGMPDVSLLIPLAKILGVTTTELLSGERTVAASMAVEDVETLVSGAISLSGQEDRTQKKQLKKQHLAIVLGCAFTVAAEIALLLALGYTPEMLSLDLLTVELLSLLFGAWFAVFARETLPAYYDENKISTYSDGIFRMNIPGVHFNNSNWPHIVSVCRIWLLTTAVLFPVLYLALSRFFPGAWELLRLPLQLAAMLGLFAAAYVVGRKYE